MIVTARQFSSAAEMMTAAAAVHAKCFKPKNRFVPKPAPAVAVPQPTKSKPKMRERIPLWERSTILFDAHVDAYAADRHIKAMVAAGQISVLQEPRKTMPEIVLETLEKFPFVTMDEVRGGSRCRRVVIARHTCMYEVKMQRPEKSFPDIGRWFGGRDHTSVLHAVRKIERMRADA
jgi:hypothetical protein